MAAHSPAYQQVYLSFCSLCHSVCLPICSCFNLYVCLLSGSLSVRLFVCLLKVIQSVSLSVCVFAYLPACLSACLLVCLSACLPVCLSAYLSDCLSACLPVCLSAYLSNLHLPILPSVCCLVNIEFCIRTSIFSSGGQRPCPNPRGTLIEVWASLAIPSDLNNRQKTYFSKAEMKEE